MNAPLTGELQLQLNGIFERELEAPMRVRARWVAGVMCAIWLYAMAVTDVTLYGAPTARIGLRSLQFAAVAVFIALLRRPRPLKQTEVIVTVGACLLSALGSTSLVKLSEHTYGFGVAFRLFAPLLIAYFLGLRWRSVLSLVIVSWLTVTFAAWQRDAAMVRGQLTLVLMVLGVPSLLLVYEAWGREQRRRQEVALREALRLANEKLRAEEEARTRLFVNLNHDFRTPLALIRAEAELLRRDLTDSDQREALERIETNSQYLADLSEQLMELARLETGRTPHQPAPTRLDLIAREVAAQLQPPGGVPAITVEGDTLIALADPVHVRRILFNLVENARRQPAARQITITLWKEAGQVGADVSDDGAGILAERREKIFERYASFDKDGRTVSGIGLPLSRELATLNGGSLTLLPQGRTTFRIALPQGIAEPPAAIHDETSAVPAARTTLPLLVVEDNAEMRALLVRSLESDFEVRVAENLAGARRQLEGIVPAAVVTDLMLPDGRGSELIPELRAQRRHEGVPVLIVSAMGTAEDRVKGLQAGADDYLAKPFSPAELLTRVRTAIAGSESRRTALQRQREEFLMELHDGVSSSLARAALLIDAGRPENALLAIREGLGEARTLMNLLDAAPASLSAVIAELRHDMTQACTQAGLELSFEALVGSPALLLSSAERHTALRMARESLTNIVKHAGAKHVSCRVELVGNTLSTTVEDDGRGIGDQAPGRGVTILKRRAEMLGGHVTIESRSPHGTRVQMHIPIANAPVRLEKPAAA